VPVEAFKKHKIQQLEPGASLLRSEGQVEQVHDGEGHGKESGAQLLGF
jgi:hypothetical protein